MICSFNKKYNLFIAFTLTFGLISCVGNPQQNKSNNTVLYSSKNISAPQPTIDVGFDVADGSIAINQNNTSLSPMIVLQFQFPMDISSINRNTVFLSTNPNKIENAVLLSQIIGNAYGTEFSFYPVSPLKPFTKYYVLLTNQITDPTGKYTVNPDKVQELKFTTGNKDTLMVAQLVDRDNMVGNASIFSLISLRFNQVARICSNRYDCKGYMNIKLHKPNELDNNLDLDFYYLGDIVLLRDDDGNIEYNTNYELSVDMTSILDRTDTVHQKFNFKTSNNSNIQLHSVTNGMINTQSNGLYLFFSSQSTQVYGSQLKIIDNNNKAVPFKIRCGLASCAMQLESDLQVDTKYRMQLDQDISDGDGNTIGYPTEIQFKTDSWQPLSNPISHSKTPNNIFVTHSKNFNDMFLAYTDGGINLPTLSVYRSVDSGKNWYAFGPVIAPAANNVSMVIDKDNNPIVAFNEIEGINSTIRVVKYNGNSWIDLLSKNKYYAPNTKGSLNLQLDNSGNPVLAFADHKNLGRLKVIKYNESTNNWADYSESMPYLSSQLAKNIDMKFNSYNNPIIAFIDLSTGDRLKILTYNSKWIPIGDVSKLNNQEVTSLSLAIRANNDIELAFSEVIAYDDGDIFHNWQLIKPKVIEYNSSLIWHILNNNQYWLANNSVDDLQLLIDDKTNTMLLGCNVSSTGYYFEQDKGNSFMVMKYQFDNSTLGWQQLNEYAYLANFNSPHSITILGSDILAFILPIDVDFKGMGIRTIKNKI